MRMPTHTCSVCGQPDRFGHTVLKPSKSIRTVSIVGTMQRWLIVFTGTVSVSARHADNGHRVHRDVSNSDTDYRPDYRPDCLDQWFVASMPTFIRTHDRLLPTVAAATDRRRCAAKLHELRLRVHIAHIHVHVLVGAFQLLLL
jgi:hypothetical protein